MFSSLKLPVDIFLFFCFCLSLQHQVRSKKTKQIASLSLSLSLSFSLFSISHSHYLSLFPSFSEEGKKFRHLIWKNVVCNGPETQLGCATSHPSSQDFFACYHLQKNIFQSFPATERKTNTLTFSSADSIKKT